MHTLLCVRCPKVEDTVHRYVFEVQHMAVLIQNQKKVFHKAKVKVILHAQLLGSRFACKMCSGHTL